MSKRKGIMLAYPFEESRLNKWGYPVILQPKLDGVRCIVKWVDSYGGIEPEMVSSEGNTILSCPHILEVLDHLPYCPQLDGELYVHGWSFEQINSVVSTTTSYHPDFEKIEYHVFDVNSTDTQVKRIAILTDYMTQENGIYWGNIKLVPSTLCHSFSEVMSVYQSYIANGYEGMIVRHPASGYIERRSTYMMKFKPKKNDIYSITGWKEEHSIQGLPKGRLGAFVCESDGNEFSVGSGLTEAQRVNFWTIREQLVGKKLLVEYQHITPGNKVPRFPVFVKVVE